MRIPNTKGFTLLEILIVLVIIAVLAGFAIPAYQTAVEKSRAQEAYSTIGAVREAMQRHYAINGSYQTPAATFTLAQPGTLDYIPPTVAGVQASGAETLFTYTLNVTGANAYTVTATRVAKTGAPMPPQGASTIAVNQAGSVTAKTGAYA